MGAYALLVAEDGEVSLGDTGRVRDLNQVLGRRTFDDPSALPAHYRSMQPNRYWQNLPGTPDFPTAAEAVRQLWPATGEWALDGMLYLDTTTLTTLLELTGPVRVEGRAEPLSADTALDFLFRGQYVEFPEDDRHDFLVEAATAVFDELTTGDLPPPRELTDALGPVVAQRRLLAHSFEEPEQRLFERLRLDGAMPPADGDLLSVRSINRGLNKIDAMAQRTMSYEVDVEPALDLVRARLTVTIRNDIDVDALPPKAVDNRIGQPPGTSSTTIVVYSPLELIDVTRDGRPISRGASTDYGLNRHTALVDIAPQSEVTVVFELAGRLELDDGYRLDVVPQPLVNPDQVRVRVDGLPGWGRAEGSITLRETATLDIPHDRER
jgi:hypothetical protein